jgi:hypothetical protein
VHGDDGYFDERIAARYDDPDDEMFDAAAIELAVDFLAELAGGGRALELGIGTGRALGWLGSGAVHEREPEARVRVGEGRSVRPRPGHRS